MTIKVARQLIMLDSLFDTRIGTIARMDTDIAAGLLHDTNYTSRLWDLFPGVDDEEFKKLYAARDVQTLAQSQTTPIVGLICDFVRRCAETSYSQPVALEPEIHINFYPYKLSEKEEDLIINMLRRIVPLKPTIEKCYFSMEQLNPLYVRNNYNNMVMYHAHEWLRIHSENKLLSEYRCENVVLWAPTKLDHKPDGVEIPPNIGEYLYSMSIYSQFLINLSYLGIDNFCSYLSAKPKTATPEPVEVDDEEIKEPQGDSHPGVVAEDFLKAQNPSVR